MKKKVTLIVTIALCLLLCSLAAFLFFTRGNTYVSEGILQNDRVTMENVRFEDGVISYTLVNRTNKRVYYSSVPTVEKYVDGEWRSFALCASRTDFSYFLPAFSEQAHSFQVNYNTDRLAGEYRLSFGAERVTTDENGVTRVKFDAQTSHIVAHLTITEKQSPTTTPVHVYYDNGVKKHAQVDFTASLVGGTEPKLLLTLTNNGEKPLTLQLSKLSLHRYQNAYFYHISNREYYMMQLEDATVAPGETLHLERPIYNERYTMEPIAPPPTGRYRVNIPYYFEGATEIESEYIGGTPRDLFYANHLFDHS